MSHNDAIYYVVSMSKMTQTLIDSSMISSAATLRKNNDNTKGLLKYELSKVPLEILNLETNPLSHCDMIIEMDKDEWVQE